MSNNYSDSLPVRIGENGEFVTTSIQGARRLLDVSVANNTIAGTPYVVNVSMPLKDTEYNYTLIPNTKQIMFKTRENSFLKFSFQPGESNINYISVPPGSSYTLEGIDPKITLTVYFQAANDAETLEIISWV